MKRVLALVPAVAAVIAAGCQRYDLEPVTPLAFRSVQKITPITALKARPDLMLMVDKSGSMNLPIDSADARCPAGCGTPAGPCPASCPTRWSELKGAMDGFLTQYGHVARMGLVPFAGPADPSIPQCAPGIVTVDTSDSSDVKAELQAQASSINAAIGALTPRDGTPTGTTLAGLATYERLANPDRDDYVLLLTDGLPNCNPDNPHDYNADPVGCRCTDPSSSTCSFGGRRLCLDEDATVANVSALNERKVKTVVVGFGAETARGDAPSVLTNMGRAGGYTLTCPRGTDAECAGGTCDLATQTCSNTYYQASNGAALSEALARLAKGLNPDPCHHELPMEPGRDSFLSVLVNGEAVERGPDTWQYTPPGGGNPPVVDLVGTLCARAQETTDLAPLNLSIQIVQEL